MKVTARINLNQAHDSSVLGYGSININDELVVKGIQIIQGRKGIYVAMPQYKGGDGKYHDKVFSLTAQGRETINNAVMQAYNAELREKNNQRDSQTTEEALASTLQEEEEQEPTQ